jgi:colanic acid/amylovoran biosynthesis glycosyltransferase
MTQSLRVLTYHRVLPDPEAADAPLVSANPEEFARQMAMADRHFQVVSLDEVLAAQRGEASLPSRALLLTFDDATPDFAEWVAPVLYRLGLPAVLFVPTAFPDGNGSFWWDRICTALSHTRRTAVAVPGLGSVPLNSLAARRTSIQRVRQHLKNLPHREAMDLVDRLCDGLEVSHVEAQATLGWADLRKISGHGVVLAPHTRTHPLLTRISASQATEEIRGSLSDIRREVGHAPPVLCYPAGDHDAAVEAAAAAAGIELAFTCMDGHTRLPTAHPLRLRRTNVSRRTTTPILRIRLHPVGAMIDRWRHRERGQRRHRVGRDTHGTHSEVTTDGSKRVAYLVSRFPKLSETFVLNEMVAVEETGVAVHLFPLRREQQSTVHPAAEGWTRRAHYRSIFSPALLRAHVAFLRRDPRVYAGALVEALSGTWGTPKFFAAAVALFPKSVLFAREMELLGITHIHAHFATHPALVALLIHRLTGIPFSFTAHGSDLHVDRRMLDIKLYAAAFAVAVSRFNRQVMVDTCSEDSSDRIRVIHCGTDPDLFAPTADQRDRSPFQIICVASLEEVKGHRFLLDACRILLDRGIDLRCHIVGDGPLETAIRKQRARLRLDNEVVLYGGVPRQDVARMIAAAHAGVLASHPTRTGRREGIPVALMEAMSCGLPVVASDISGIPELIDHGKTGFLVPSGDPQALADALDLLARDADLCRYLGEAGRKRIMADFHVRENARRLASHFTAGPSLKPVGPHARPAEGRVLTA